MKNRPIFMKFSRQQQNQPNVSHITTMIIVKIQDAVILKIVMLSYLVEKSSDLNELWFAYRAAFISDLVATYSLLCRVVKLKLLNRSLCCHNDH